MKLIIAILILAGNIVFIACSKKRTCTCKISETITTVTTPRGAGQASTSVSNNSGEYDQTIGYIKKKDMKKLSNCNSRTQTSTTSYTSTTSTYNQNIYVTYTTNVVQTTIDDYSCKVK